MTATVFQIQRFCIHDGFGIRTSVFLKGCPLHCPWCHNPEGLSDKIQTDSLGTTYGRVMTAEQVFAEIVKDKAYYDISGGGATFTGGEPLCRAEFVAHTAELCKNVGMNVAVETSGFAAHGSVEKVLPFTDSVLFDIKCFDGDRLRRVVGADINVVMRNLDIFATAGVSVILRSPIIRGFNDDDAHFVRLGELAARTENVVAVELLPYHKLGLDKSKRLGVPFCVYEETARETLGRAVRLVRMNFKNVSAA